MRTLQDLFIDGLEDMYSAEQQLTKALPKLAKAATHEDLREAIEGHLAETKGHVEKVEQIFAAFNKTPKARKCAAVAGLIHEADEIVSENKNAPTINAAIIFAAQKTEHYEISSYGTLREWARRLDNTPAVELIEKILEEEKMADDKLTGLAELHCNITAQAGSDEKEEALTSHPA